jgi:HAD superfamily hydrolase (TIGR01450 family)
MSIAAVRPRIDLKQVDLILCDIDGVVLLGQETIPGAFEALNVFRKNGINVVFCTNSSTETPETFSARLSRAGYACHSADVVTSGIAAARHLAHRLPAGAEILIVGEAGLFEVFSRSGFVPIRSEEVDLNDPVDPAAVVVGLDRDITYRRIHVAASVARRGVPFLRPMPMR